MAPPAWWPRRPIRSPSGAGSSLLPTRCMDKLRYPRTGRQRAWRPSTRRTRSSSTNWVQCTQIPAANSVTYIGLWDHATSAQLTWATHSAKTAAETPTAEETTAANGPAGPARVAARAAIQTKANAWRDRIIAAYNAGLDNWATDATVPKNAIVAIAFEHPKYSNASPDSVTTEWTAFPWLTITVEGKVPQPDQRWINGEGVSYGNRAYITAGMTVARTKVVIAHEADMKPRTSSSVISSVEPHPPGDHSGRPG